MIPSSEKPLHSGNSGLYQLENDGVLTAKSTLVAGNQGENCNSDGTATSNGYNLSDDSCGIFNAATDRNNTPADLDPNGLQNNGGPTQTIALLSKSPAINAIPAANCTDNQGNPITTVQRRIKRPQSAGCDIGAFELVQNTPFSSSARN
ncbi:hypothetical protein DYQ86_04595 [Acidobacteria bacterium AB60]|nr:hypothetical protein DYQ86_04595 [Acidobacteria bacterium AB60]